MMIMMMMMMMMMMMISILICYCLLQVTLFMIHGDLCINRAYIMQNKSLFAGLDFLFEKETYDIYDLFSSLYPTPPSPPQKKRKKRLTTESCSIPGVCAGEHGMSNRLPFVVTNPPKAMLIDQRLVENSVDHAIEIPWDTYIIYPWPIPSMGRTVYLPTFVWFVLWYMWVNWLFVDGME